jgi:hypothetical protein
MCSAFRFCLSVYLDFDPWGMPLTQHHKCHSPILFHTACEKRIFLRRLGLSMQFAKIGFTLPGTLAKGSESVKRSRRIYGFTRESRFSAREAGLLPHPARAKSEPRPSIFNDPYFQN